MSCCNETQTRLVPAWQAVWLRHGSKGTQGPVVTYTSIPNIQPTLADTQTINCLGESPLGKHYSADLTCAETCYKCNTNKCCKRVQDIAPPMQQAYKLSGPALRHAQLRITQATCTATILHTCLLQMKDQPPNHTQLFCGAKGYKYNKQRQ